MGREDASADTFGGLRSFGAAADKSLDPCPVAALECPAVTSCPGDDDEGGGADVAVDKLKCPGLLFVLRGISFAGTRIRLEPESADWVCDTYMEWKLIS